MAENRVRDAGDGLSHHHPRSADLLTGAGLGHRNTVGVGGALIVVGLAVAAAHQIDVLRAAAGHDRAHALSIAGAAALRERVIAEVTRVAAETAQASAGRLVAFTLRRDRDAGEPRHTVVTVRLAVAAADGGVDGDAADVDGDLGAHPRRIGAAAIR